MWSPTALAASAPPASLPPADAALVADVASFKAIPIGDGIPGTILDCCADAQGRLARPGEPWNSTDVVPPGSTRAQRRLLWAVQGPQLTVIHYEQGGFAHTYHVVLLRRAPWMRGHATTWEMSTGRHADFAQFAQAQAGATTTAP
jgi:hypothetical protein